MKVIHGTWIPEQSDAFIQRGDFYLWVETDETNRIKGGDRHPRHLQEKKLADFLKNEIGITPDPRQRTFTDGISNQTIFLPTYNQKPLPSPELDARLEEEYPDDPVPLSPWQVESCRLRFPIKAISDIHFLSFYQAEDTQPGSDFLFWYYFSQSLKQSIAKDQYIPALLYREQKGRAKNKRYEIYTLWQILSDRYEDLIQQSVDTMPLACANGHDKENLLRQFAEVSVQDIVSHVGSKLPASFTKKVRDTFVDGFMTASYARQPWQTAADLTIYRQWNQWRARLAGSHEAGGFNLCFQLREASADKLDVWSLIFQVTSKRDPSFKTALADYWTQDTAVRNALAQQLGGEFERQLLLDLGAAARMYPKIWEGMETDTPAGIELTLDEAFEFLKENAWILEDAGFKVIIPAWWTPKGRRRAKIRLRSPRQGNTTNSGSGTSGLSLDNLLEYQYQLTIGDQRIDEQEWAQLVDAKKPLIHFRGQWMELDREKMQQMLEFWQQHGSELPTIQIQDLIKKLAEDADTFEVEPSDALGEMLANLREATRLEPVDNPEQLNAHLREYQKRGVAWLSYLERLGLNGCLADDMGLGKTMQVIAGLVIENAKNQATPPTLLVAPTSVLGNWQKEIEKFAPHLKTVVHHGAKRESDPKAFKKLCFANTMMITSYALARKDIKLFSAIDWQRVVLDEAQNIKNPKAAQTKAVLKLNAPRRLALTGTPVENRLMDLWSIFNFLNPGYLGKQAQFRKAYELPIQRDNNPLRSATLKKLVEPFILRRLKTDKNIIKDLPDKIENKQFSTLSKEQASLYEAVVADVAEKLDDSEGIERQGLMLSTLMKLKQICNHPMQFLQDSSAFSAERSPKLERLNAMLEEAIAEGDSVLVFTQFTEIGENLEKYLQRELNCNTFYLYGGTSRTKREKMIDAFQAPETPPSVFILSVKAGGVGITLTKANHVFHFDRWWNPAVEDQATDRAFRIGQRKNVWVHKFVTLGTVEERIDTMIEEKKKIAQSIVGNDESWLTRLDNDAFKTLIALNKQAVLG